MQYLWQKYLQGREKRCQEHFEYWEKKRQKGHRYVLGITFFYGAWMVIGTSITDYYFDGFFDWWSLPKKILKYFIIGFILGAYLWWDSERSYQKTLKSSNVS